MAVPPTNLLIYSDIIIQLSLNIELLIYNLSLSFDKITPPISASLILKLPVLLINTLSTI